MAEKPDTLMNWKAALGVIVGLVISGAVGTVMITTFLDDRAAEKFYAKSAGEVLESKIAEIPEVKNDIKNINNQQTQILIQLGEIKGKLDNISK